MSATSAAKVARWSCSGQAGEGRPGLATPEAHYVGEQASPLVVYFPAEGRPHSPLQGRTGNLFTFFRGHSHPSGEQLLVEPVRPGRRVGGGPALEPQGETPRSRPGPGHEQLAALVDEAGLAEPGLASHDHNSPFAERRLPEGLTEHPELRGAPDERGAPSEAAPASLAIGSCLGALEVGSLEGLGAGGNGHLLCRSPLEEALGCSTCGRANEH